MFFQFGNQFFYRIEHRVRGIRFVKNLTHQIHFGKRLLGNKSQQIGMFFLADIAQFIHFPHNYGFG